MNKDIIISSADEKFVSLLFQGFESLKRVGVWGACDIAVIDQGLSLSSIIKLKADGVQVIRPSWPSYIPTHIQKDSMLGLSVRPLLRDLFPGYEFYLWFDADAWVADGRFFEVYKRGAAQKGAAVAMENGCGYNRPFFVKRWWYGNLVLAFGALVAMRVAFQTSINIGLLGLNSCAPHWKAWQGRYEQSVSRTGKINLDQHSFFTAFHYDCQSSGALLPATMNWLPTLSVPIWNSRHRILVEPGRSAHAISVVHLAGPDKDRQYTLRSNDGTGLQSALTYQQMALYMRRDSHASD